LFFNPCRFCGGFLMNDDLSITFAEYVHAEKITGAAFFKG
jgi:hypothetical protein